MSIKLLINGFFRSGTTIVWKIFRESNPDIISFYEPCHEEILDRLELFQRKPYIDKLHNISVWDEYFKPPGLIPLIRRHHPNPGKGNIFPDNERDVVDYTKVYDDLDIDVILQTNRWGLFLEEIHKELGAPIMHITRNPFDVYRSMQNVYFGQGSIVKNITKNAFIDYFSKRAFSISKMYEHISRKFGLRLRQRKTKLDDEFNSEAFDMFFIVWSVTNYYAIKAMEDGKGLAITHEVMLQRPDGAKGVIEAEFGIAFNHGGILKQPTRAVFLSDEENKLLLKTAQELNIYDEFFYVAKNAGGALAG
ncbi:hypothetical protein MNBD_NITROSPINAE02-2215 [hydrothermal vent metagenome]|uniref:Sulfotransferase domain-containing protein n=1 Tax=hydrothermal vent metagenome TaxID=652676 RepID=A0A3B1C1E6_9ZZZZ